MNIQMSVKKHEGKIRLHVEWPVEGGDSDLVRKKDFDLPIVLALAVAAGIVSESVATLRFPPSPRTKGAEKAAELKAAVGAKSEQANGVAGGAEHERENGAREQQAPELGDLGVARKGVDQGAGDGDEHGDQSDHGDSLAPSTPAES